jgi:hypothetical protein
MQYSSDQKIVTVDVVDLKGVLVPVPVTNNSSGKQIDVSGLAQGDYFIRILSEKGTIYKKLIVSK